MSPTLNSIALPATVGFATACLLLASLLPKVPPTQSAQPEKRKFGMAGSECRTLTDHSFEIFKDFGPGKVPLRFKNLLLPEIEAERLLKQNAKSVKVQRPGNVAVQYDTNFVSVNAVNEDRFAVNLLPGDLSVLTMDGEQGFWQRWAQLRNTLWVDDKAKDEIKAGHGVDDLLLVSVIDGHGGGPDVADLVSRVLHACLAKALAVVGARDDIVKVLDDVFVALQEDILRLPVTVLQDHLPDPALSPILPRPAPTLVSLANIARRGACTSTAIVDMKTNKLYVANLGDCRIVGGWFDPKTGQWRCEVMSNMGDGCVGNPVEVAYVKSLHPGDDVTVCDTGRGMRILGSGQPTRAFGDCIAQLTDELTDELETVLDVPLHEFLHVKKKSPPYMPVHPDLVVKDLNPASGEQLRFLILAVDGLWDKLSSEEACLLAAAYYDQPLRDPIAKTQLPELYPLTRPGPSEKRPFPAEPFPGTMGVYAEGNWEFRGDDDVATHLIRNAMGRGDAWEAQRMISLAGPLARSYRDDTTVVVVKFDHTGAAQTQTA